MMADKLILCGWKERIALSKLNINHLKVKMDTGAKTSALHVDEMFITKIGEIDYVNFTILRKKSEIYRFKKYNYYSDSHIDDSENDLIAITNICPVKKRKNITSSNGTKEERVIINSSIYFYVNCGEKIISWDIDISLTRRNDMLFKMLIGRDAMIGKIIIDPSDKYVSRIIDI
ncbi:MAG TPA: RimK/LysX family protein [Candidatus Megaira endosymbiont of Hartmannula sinica]|nr:RimK/LysX family protein [Candidatus Megaera endosymbiont of Hartmannula sinica]